MTALTEQDADELTEFAAQRAAVDDENDLFDMVAAIVARHRAEAGAQALRDAAEAAGEFAVQVPVLLPGIILPQWAWSNRVADFLNARAASVEAEMTGDDRG